MSRLLLIYGQPASGKSFSLRKLDPKTSVIIDADLKGALPWRGSAKTFSKDAGNFFSVSSLDKIQQTVSAITTQDKWAHISTLVIDGFNNAMMSEVMFYDDANKTGNKFEKYDQVAKKTLRVLDTAQKGRNDLTIIFTAHVEISDPFSPTDVDKVFTPGKFLKEKVKIESKFLYVFYAKVDDSDFYFETVPNKSTARAPLDCFPPRIPNDVVAAIDTIKIFEEGSDDD